MSTSVERYPVAIGLSDTVKRGGGYIANITSRVWPTYRRTIGRIGGYLQGTSDYIGTNDEMDDMFLYGLERQVKESICGLTLWQGIIGAMTYTRNGVTLTRTLADATNAIKSIYTRLFDNLLTNGSAESGAWTVYHTATVTQDATWFTNGSYSCKIVTVGSGTLPGGARINGAGYTLTVAANQVYNISVDLNVIAGSWRISVNRADNDQSLAFFSTRGRYGQMTAQMTIPNTSTYAGLVDMRITAEEAGAHSAWTIYGDNASFVQPPIAAQTSWAKGAVSMMEFGEIQRILLRAGLSDGAANAEVATLLRQSAWIRTTPPDQLSLTGQKKSTPNRLTLTYIGFVHTLDWRNTVTTGSSTIDAVIAQMINQAEFVTVGSITANATPFTIENRADQTLWKVITDALASGDSAGVLSECGVYDQRKLFYHPIDESIKYRIDDGKVLNALGADVDPWLVVPAYCEIQDFPPGPGSISGYANDDPRIQLIDEVEFVAPATLNLKRWKKPT